MIFCDALDDLSQRLKEAKKWLYYSFFKQYFY